jgi:ribosome biogenesis GTPase / thiamine phosphate phosphatase
MTFEAPAPLRAIGLGPLQWRQAQSWVGDTASPIPATPMRVIEVHRDRLRLHDGHADHPARAQPRLLRELEGEASAIAVGDWLMARPEPDGGLWALARLAPINHLVRRDADGRRHPVVSNVDLALLVMGLDADFNLRRLERYLALVQGQGVPAVVVLTKADEAAAGVVEAALASVQRRLPGPLPVLAVDGTSTAAATALAPWLLPGQTLVLLGSSGAGKSTLTNSLAGRVLQDTGAVRSHDHRGQHTTTSRTLFVLPGGACVIDTPGLRALRPDLDERGLAASFDDIARLAPQCRFRNCSHATEPGCAVRPVVDADRLRNHEKLLREARRDNLNPLERRRQLTQWKLRGREGEARARQKREPG